MLNISWFLSDLSNKELRQGLANCTLRFKKTNFAKKLCSVCGLQSNLIETPVILKFAGLQKPSKTIISIGYSATATRESRVPHTLLPFSGSDGIKCVLYGLKEVNSKFRSSMGGG